MSVLAFDLRTVVRTLRRSPAFTAVAVLSLGAALGATLVAGRLLDTLYFRPPPGVGAPSELVRLYFGSPDDAGQIAPTRTSYPAFLGLRAARTLKAAGAYWTLPALLGASEYAHEGRISVVSHDYFATLGLRALLGELPEASADQPGAARTVVLSETYWRAHLQGSPAVLGAALDIDGRPYTITGVAAPGFQGLDPDMPTDAWVPLGAAEPIIGRDALDNPSNLWLRVVARPRHLDVPDAALAQEATQILEQHGAAEFERRPVRVTIGPLNESRGSFRPVGAATILWVTAVTGLLLVAAITNVAGLAITRAVARRAAHAIRLALGATPRDLRRTALVESLILVAVASLVACAIGSVASPIARHLGYPTLAPVHALTWVILLSLGALVATAVLTGPVLVVAGSTPGPVVRQRAAEGTMGVRRVQHVLLVCQSALACALLLGALAFGIAFRRAATLDLGFDADRLIAVSLDRRVHRLSGAARAERLAALEERVGTSPGAAGVALSSLAPFHDREQAVLSTRDGRERLALHFPVAPAYFRTTGMRLTAGRAFTAADRQGSPLVVLVNEVLARQLWPDGSAIGSCVIYSTALADGCATLVGVVRTATYARLEEEETGAFFIPLAQAPVGDTRVLMVRARGSIETALSHVREAAASVGLSSGVIARPVRELIAPQMRPVRTGAILFAGLGTSALVLTLIGMYSVTSLVVLQERRHIGIRMALGASSTAVVRDLAVRGALLAGSGGALGIGAATLLAKTLRGVLPTLDVPMVPMMVLAVAATTCTAALASFIPARRAAHVAPTTALRYD